MLTSKGALWALIRAHNPNLEALTRVLNISNAIGEIQKTFGEFAEATIDFVKSYAAKFSYPAPSHIYKTVIDYLAKMLTDDAVPFAPIKRRIPMLPELQAAIEKRGFSLTILRGTSHLCEVQISPIQNAEN